MTRKRRKEISKRRVNNESLRAALIKHKLQKKYGGGFVDNEANKNLIEQLIAQRDPSGKRDKLL